MAWVGYCNYKLAMKCKFYFNDLIEWILHMTRSSCVTSPLQGEKDGNSMLHIACQRGNVEVARGLVEYERKRKVDHSNSVQR